MPLLDPMQPFTHAEARSAGISDRALRGPAYRKVFPNVYVDAIVPDTLVVRCRAAQRILPSDAVFSHGTAARLWCGAIQDDPNVHAAFTRPVSSTVAGIKVHRFTHAVAAARRHGLAVTTPEQTLLHLARPLDLVELVCCADQLLRRRVTSAQDLVVAAERWPGQGSRLARQAALLAREEVDSRPETQVRLLMVLAGLPEPVVNHKLRRRDASVQYRMELSFPQQRLAIEYDGRWHEEPEQKLRDETRRADLAGRGWRFVVLHAEDLYEMPEDTLLHLQRELSGRGITVPSVLSDAWRQHFTQRGLVA
jgi:very-short-patch-repair endonuclease